MSTTSKSPKRVLAVAYRIGCAALAPYAHRSSPKKFTQPQLFACLVLKEFLQLDYRKLAALLGDCTELAATIELQVIPHFTTGEETGTGPIYESESEGLRGRPGARSVASSPRAAAVDAIHDVLP
ncbi:MAG: hypothetical protein K1X74_03455 [Pirellulales bacterium]|nr:hypothetical protein [Pirellulales bacterium]